MISPNLPSRWQAYDMVRERAYKQHKGAALHGRLSRQRAAAHGLELRLVPQGTGHASCLHNFSAAPLQSMDESEKGRRQVAVPAFVLRALQERRGEGLMFITKNNTPLLHRNLKRHFQKTLVKSVLPCVRFHDVRRQPECRIRRCV